MIRKIINFFAKIISFIFPYKFFKGIRFFKSCFFSACLTRRFKQKVTCFDFPNINGEKYIKFIGNMTIGYGCRIEAIDKYSYQLFNPKIIFGQNVIIGNYCHIAAIEKVVIGANTLVGSNVLIIDHSHGNLTDYNNIEQRKRELLTKGEVFIGENCWIGEDVCILPGVKIGSNCIIGAGSVVTKSFLKPNCLIAGNPAKVIYEGNSL